MTASALFTAAHLTARRAHTASYDAASPNAGLTYRQRFAAALKTAYMVAKLPTVMEADGQTYYASSVVAAAGKEQEAAALALLAAAGLSAVLPYGAVGYSAGRFFDSKGYVTYYPVTPAAQLVAARLGARRQASEIMAIAAIN